MSDEQVAELQNSIMSEFDKVEGEDPTPETVDAMTSLADSLDIVRGELARREALAEQLAAQAAEATARVKGTDESTGEEMAMDENKPMEEDVPVEETPTEEAPVPAEEVPAEETPVEETPAEETPVEDEEEKKKMSEYSSDSEEVATTSEVVEVVEEVAAPEAELSTTNEATETASIAQEDGSELSTEETQTESTPTVTEESQEEQAPVTAAAEQPFEAPADRQPVVQVSEPAPVAITAGADIPGYTAGSTINDMSEVAVAMEKRLHSLRRVNGGDGEQHIVASFTTSYPEERILNADPESNAKKIAAVAGPEALVAAGGFSTPFEVKYDIFSIGSTNVRPIRDALPRFQVDRGGVRFISPPTYANLSTTDTTVSNAGTYAKAADVWTASNDAAASPSPSSKATMTIAAASEKTATTDAVTLQLQFGNLMTRAYPELIARHNELALVQHARRAEENLIAGINSNCTAVTTSSVIGVARDFLVNVRRAAVAYRLRHRLNPNARLKLIIPVWVYDAMAADLTLNMPGDGNLSVSQSEIDGYLASLNVDVVSTLDNTAWTTAAANFTSSLGTVQSGSSGALNQFPDSFKWFLFAEGTFLFLDGGTLDLGIIRDSSLVGTNDYKMFVETFEGVGFVGIEALAVTSTIKVNGTYALGRDMLGGVASASIDFQSQPLTNVEGGLNKRDPPNTKF